MKTRAGKKKKHPKLIRKTILLAPQDAGPICSDTPLCSSTSYLPYWRQATYTMTQKRVREVTKVTIEQWVRRLVQRELTWDLHKAQEKLGRQLKLVLDADDCEIIKTALEIRGGR